MSIEAYVWALKHAPVTPTDRDRVVLFALADHADDRGRNAFPSQATIANYIYGEASPAGLRKVQRALKSLIEGGWITPDPDNAKLQAVMPRVHPSQRPVAYTLNLSFVRTPPDTSDGTLPTLVTGGRAGAPVTSDPGPPSPVSKPPVTSDGRTVSNHQENRQGGGVGTSRTGMGLSDRAVKENGADAPGMDEKRSTGPALCPVHGDQDPGTNCHGCRQAREAREADQQNTGRARRAQIDQCDQCDANGWLLHVLPVVRCTHSPAAEHQPGAPAPADLEHVSPEGPEAASSRAPAA
ncbi:helix-turn-helix domain-containing protein [Corynebacterium hylobatis]|uniref:Helix-turn-helix domain-containing protein n=1 Tax=Corynebacterium hylobatis TaxID=1859290 RepID=A0A3S0B585_9CORY|nr:helix-turn-helix domain-containing protein [Corynebacterium hylobatis]